MPTAREALAAVDKSIRRVQTILGVDADGDFGPKSRAKLLVLRAHARRDEAVEWPIVEATDWHSCKASSFADPADIARFKKCKATGKTDKQCFAVGDNGIGLWKDNTAQERIPMCALHGDDMVEKFGSINGAMHARVIVRINGKTVDCLLADRMSARNRVDLNPAALKAFGLKAPLLAAAEWRWA